jgi:AcrR family transcriptional regulator
VHSADDFLAAAARLFAAGGARALTMNAVAREVGAPSGSIYHRFPDRAALLAALWLRTARGFQTGYLDVLGQHPTPGSAIRAAVWTVNYCGKQLPEAIVLQAGVRAFEPDDWPERTRAELSAIDTELRQRIGTAVRVLSDATGRPPDQIAFAMLDLPLGAVRQRLLAGKPPTKRATELVHDLASLILATTSVG